jgi:hypothetical protein
MTISSRDFLINDRRQMRLRLEYVGPFFISFEGEKI